MRWRSLWGSLVCFGKPRLMDLRLRLRLRWVGLWLLLLILLLVMLLVLLLVMLMSLGSLGSWRSLCIRLPLCLRIIELRQLPSLRLCWVGLGVSLMMRRRMSMLLRGLLH
mmetsp:Transcript_34736/g.77917  ORF Transcript_34736/g.77917 Transcript_34736/m.77917 type:complete len:110 (-) Transcript_34736:481-810(-)